MSKQSSVTLRSKNISNNGKQIRYMLRESEADFVTTKWGHY